MIDYKRIAEEIADNLKSEYLDENLYDKDYKREHLMPETFDIDEDEKCYNFSIGDIRWFNDFESGEEWDDETDEFDGDKLAEELEKHFESANYECDDEYFTIII